VNLDDGPAARVFTGHDVGIQHGDEGVEVSVARGGEESFNDFMLCGRIGVGGRIRAADAAAPASSASCSGSMPSARSTIGFRQVCVEWVLASRLA